MSQRVQRLAELSVCAARPEYREELLERLKAVRSSNALDRSEIYETFLQLYLFVGFPAALEAMKALSRAWPEVGNGKDVLYDPSVYTEYLQRGQDLYQHIYGKNAETVKQEMIRLSPDLALWAVTEGYGKTLARPGLDVVTRELCIVAVLTQLGWSRQLFSHILGALNAGASRAAIEEAVTIGAKGNAGARSSALQLLAKAE